jgi:hypothetical protein
MLCTIYYFGISRDRCYIHIYGQTKLAQYFSSDCSDHQSGFGVHITQLATVGASSYKLVAVVSAINRPAQVGSKLWVSLTRNCKLRVEGLLRSRKTAFVLE